MSDDSEKLQLEELNLESESFDPALALAAENLILPAPNVRAFNNLSEYENMVAGKVNKGPKPKLEPKLVACTVKVPRKEEKNVITMMENAKGPLGYLYKCIKDRIMVKVWTRRAGEMRGVCKGYVEAFDHHWNLVLSDVDEFCLIPTHLKQLPCAMEKLSLDPTTPPTQVSSSSSLTTSSEHLKSASKMTMHQRHVAQMFVRGDNVAFISVC